MAISREEARAWLEKNGGSLEVDKVPAGGGPIWTLVALGRKVSLEVDGGASPLDEILRRLVEKALAQP